MASYKLPLIKAYPVEMKFLTGYAYTLGAKLVVDELGFVGLIKDSLDVNYPNDEDAAPPLDIEAFPGILSLPTSDDLESKKLAIVGLYHWAKNLDFNLYRKIDLIQVPEGAPEEEQTTEAWLAKVEA